MSVTSEKTEPLPSFIQGQDSKKTTSSKCIEGAVGADPREAYIENLGLPFFGLVPYAEGLRLQEKHWLEVRQGGADRFLCLEHPPVVTFGRRGSPDRDLKVAQDQINGVEFFQIDRGGEAVLHSPGQLVIYPIVNLRRRGWAVEGFVKRLEAITMVVLAEWGVPVVRAHAEPGLYSAKGKMAFFGLRIQEGISRHGLAINVRNDLGLFSLIRCCGRSEERFDRLGDHAPRVELGEVAQKWLHTWGKGVDPIRGS